MHTTQAVIARLESGRVKPSTRTREAREALAL
jgi:predicted transcriptional regulator